MRQNRLRSLRHVKGEEDNRKRDWDVIKFDKREVRISEDNANDRIK